jgi:hypothetical protein
LAIALGELDKKVRSKDSMTLRDLQVEHAHLREYAKYFSDILSERLEEKAKHNALLARRPLEPKLTGDKAALLLRSTLKSTGLMMLLQSSKSKSGCQSSSPWMTSTKGKQKT